MTLSLPSRSAKPRTRGITSMIDFGPDTFGWTGAPEGIRNVLEACADYIDYAKIYALNALLLPPAIVKAAARIYRDYGVIPFAGGILFEYAWQKKDLDGLERLLIEADPYRFPQQHAELVKTFGPEVNLANITPGQVLRLEGFRRGIGRAVDYSIIAR